VNSFVITNVKMTMWKEKNTEEAILLDKVEVDQTYIDMFQIRNDLEVLGDLIFKTDCFVCKMFWVTTLKGLHNK